MRSWENWKLECSLPQYLHVAHGARAELCLGVKWRCVQVCAQLRLMRVCELQSWLCTSWVPLTGRGLLPLHILSCTAWRDCRTAASSAVRSSSTLYALPSMCELFPMSPVAQIEFTPLVLPPLRPRFIAVPDKLVYRKMFWTLLTNFLLTLIIPR